MKTKNMENRQERGKITMNVRKQINSNMRLMGYEAMSKTALFESPSSKQPYMIVQDFDLNTQTYSDVSYAETKDSAYGIFAEQSISGNPYMKRGSMEYMLKESLETQGYPVHREVVEGLYEYVSMDKSFEKGKLLNPEILEDSIQELRCQEAYEYKHPIRSLDDIIDILEEYGWNVDKYGDRWMDIRKASGLGEDFGFEIESDTVESCIQEITSYAQKFDYEDHASLWIGMSEEERIRQCVPGTNEDLLEDAKGIQNDLLVLSAALSSCPILEQQIKGREERD